MLHRTSSLRVYDHVLSAGCRALGRYFERQVKDLHALRGYGQAGGHEEVITLTPGSFKTSFDQVVSAFSEGFRRDFPRDQTPVASNEAQRDAWEGFTLEGQAMKAALLDALSWRPRRVAALLGDYPQYRYTIHVGVGWAWARLGPWLARQRPSPALDPLLRWLVFDGLGFHDALFQPSLYARQTAPRASLHGYERRAWDQGAGRCLWFCAQGEPGPIATTIDAYAPDRREALWSGVGLAATYAGGVKAQTLTRLRSLADTHWPALAQGACFAAKARSAAACIPEHTHRACAEMLDLSPEEAAQVTDRHLQDLPADAPGLPAYEQWRRRIQHQFGTRVPLPA